MPKFEAEKLDLTLELTTLTGEEVTLDPSLMVNSLIAKDTIQHWRELEVKAKKEKMSGIGLLATELAHLYPRGEEWFLENFDPGTLADIMAHVSQTIGGLKKRETS